MKKTYQKPTMEVVNVELQQFCAGSDAIPMGGNYDGKTDVLSNDEFDIWSLIEGGK